VLALAQGVVEVERASIVAASHACGPFAPFVAAAEVAASAPHAFLVSEVAAVAAAREQPHVGGHRHRGTDPDRDPGLGLGLGLYLDLA